MARWRVLVGPDEEPVGPLEDATVTDAFNRFAREAQLTFVDQAGDLSDTFPDFTPVKVQYLDADGTWRTRLGGFVVDQSQERGRLRVHLLSHDSWLRRRDVFWTVTDSSIRNALKELVTEYTPLFWNADLVTVENEETITRTWRGEKLVEVIEELSSISAREEFGANDSQEFFFRPRETQDAPRDFTVGEYQDYEIQNDAKEDVNRVVVYYGEGDNTGIIAVSDLERQKEIQDQQGAPRPAVDETSRTFPEISSEEAAERKGRAILEGKNSVRRGTLDTWNGLELEPGMVTFVEIPEKDIATEFRIAQIRYGRSETKVWIAENNPGVVDVLVNLSQEITRLDMRDADPNATLLDIVDLHLETGFAYDIQVREREARDDLFAFGEMHGEFGDVGGGVFGARFGPWSTTKTTPSVPETTVLVSVEAGGRKHQSGGADATVNVSSEGGGEPSYVKEGGGEATVTVSPSAGGEKTALGGGVPTVTVTPEAGGLKDASDGGEVSVLVDADGAGIVVLYWRAGEPDGAFGRVGLPDTSGGEFRRPVPLIGDGGGEATVTVSSDGGGEKAKFAEGGGETTVSVQADGDGEAIDWLTVDGFETGNLSAYSGDV